MGLDLLEKGINLFSSFSWTLNIGGALTSVACIALLLNESCFLIAFNSCLYNLFYARAHVRNCLTLCIQSLESEVKFLNQRLLVQDNVLAADLINCEQDYEVGVNQWYDKLHSEIHGSFCHLTCNVGYVLFIVSELKILVGCKPFDPL